MARRWMVAAIGTVLVLLAVTAALGVERPTLPDARYLVGERVGYCDGGRPVALRGYNLSGSADFMEMKVFGQFVDGEFQPVLWFIYPAGDEPHPASRIVVTLPNQAPYDVTYAQLLAAAPAMCDVFRLKEL